MADVVNWEVGSLDTSGNLSLDGGITIGGAIGRTIVIPGASGLAGATAGWTGFGSNDTPLARCPASQTAATYLIPISGVNVGDTITSFKVNGQIDSIGGTVTLDASLYVTTAAVAGSTPVSLGAITQISATADTLVASSKTLATPFVVVTNKTFFVYLVATTAGTTDIEVSSIEITVV